MLSNYLPILEARNFYAGDYILTSDKIVGFTSFYLANNFLGF